MKERGGSAVGSQRRVESFPPVYLDFGVWLSRALFDGVETIRLRTAAYKKNLKKK